MTRGRARPAAAPSGATSPPSSPSSTPSRRAARPRSPRCASSSPSWKRRCRSRGSARPTSGAWPSKASCRTMPARTARASASSRSATSPPSARGWPRPGGPARSRAQPHRLRGRDPARARASASAQAALKRQQLHPGAGQDRAALAADQLTAPVAGTVQQVAVHTEGGVVTPAQVLMVIVPEDAEVTAEVAMDNKDIGFVNAGADGARSSSRRSRSRATGRSPRRVKTRDGRCGERREAGRVSSRRA